MKIALVTEYYYPSVGGIQEHVHHFGLEMLHRGHDVRVITSNHGDRGEPTESAPLPTIRLGRSVPLYANASMARVTIGAQLGQKLSRVFERERFDVVHVHSPLVPTLPILAVTRSLTLTVGTFHTNFKGSFFLRMLNGVCRRYLSRLDGLIAVSEVGARALRRYFDDIDLSIVPNGVDTDKFSPSVARLPQYDDGSFNLLWIGRIEPRNGLDRMINAFIHASRERSNLRLIVVGDGAMRRLHEEMVPEHLKSRVVFLGTVNAERPSLYASADAICIPFTIACHSITLLEALAAGKPIIASDIDSFSNVISDGQEGMLLDTANPELFGRAINTLASNPELAAHMAQRSRESGLRFAWPRITDQVLDIYREAADRHRPEMACRLV